MSNGSFGVPGIAAALASQVAVVRDMMASPPSVLDSCRRQGRQSAKHSRSLWTKDPPSLIFTMGEVNVAVIVALLQEAPFVAASFRGEKPRLPTHREEPACWTSTPPPYQPGRGQEV